MVNFHVDFNASGTLRKWPSINAQRNAGAEHHWKGSVAMSLLIVLGALMFVAYRGYSVLLFAPIAALGAVLLTEPSRSGSAAPLRSVGFMAERRKPS